MYLVVGPRGVNFPALWQPSTRKVVVQNMYIPSIATDFYVIVDTQMSLVTEGQDIRHNRYLKRPYLQLIADPVDAHEN